MNTDPSLEVLWNKEAVREVRCQFGWALDTRDWQLLESLLAPEVDADFSALGVPPKRMTAAELVGMFQHAFRGEGTRTQQLYSNFVVEVEGTTAHCTSYLHGQHFTPGFPGGEEFQIRAAYRDQLFLDQGKWRITATQLVVFFVTGNAAMVS